MLDIKNIEINKNEDIFLVINPELYDPKSLNKYNKFLFIYKDIKKLHSESEWDNYNYTLLDKVYVPHNIISFHYNLVHEYFEKSLKILADKLNLLHKTNYDLEYWRCIVGPWLQLCIHVFYDRYNTVAKLNENYSKIICRSSKFPEYFCLAKDFDSFCTIINDNKYNEYIYYFIFNERKNNVVFDETITKEFFNSNEEERDSSSFELKTKISLKNILIYIVYLFSRIFSRYIFINSYIPNLKNLYLSLFSFPFFSNKELHFKSDRVIDFDKRRKLKTIHSEDEFLNILFKFISKQLPKCYLEHYSLARKKALSYYPLWPKIIVTANSHYSNEFFKIWAAEKRFKYSAKIIICQHGGYYGLGKLKTLEDLEVTISDYFISFGWIDAYKKNIIPLSTPKLTSFANELLKKEKKVILLVHLNMIKYQYYFCSWTSGELFYDYLNCQSNFLNNLNELAFNDITVRIQDTEFGWNLDKYYKNKFPNVQVYKGNRTFIDHLSEVKLVLVTYNATTLLETLSSNIPTVIFWDAEYFALRDEVNEYFEEFKRVGIFHTTPESAAIFVNQIYDNIDFWWNTSELQSIRLKFCEKYARTSDNWLSEWSNLLKNL